MAGKSSGIGGVAVLAAMGAWCIAFGIFAVKAGAGTHVYRNQYGQLSAYAFFIPVGVALLALSLVEPLARLRRRLTLRRAVREQRRRSGRGEGPR